MNTPNERAVIGGNDAPDFAKMEVERLNQDYAALKTTAADLVVEAEAIPGEIPDAETKGKVTSLIKRIRDAKVRIEGMHELEKQPHLRRGQGVDQFFFGIWDVLAKRAKNNRDGIGDVLQKKLTAYDTRILAEEQERRRKAAAEAAEVERKARVERERLEQEQRDREEAAARARAPAKIEEKEQKAAEASEAASFARVEETVASQAAEQAYIETLAKPADIMRQRGDDGTLSTMGTEKFAEITDRKTLDLEPLRAYLKADALQTALNAYAASHAYSSDPSVQIKGARFGKRPKSMVR